MQCVWQRLPSGYLKSIVDPRGRPTITAGGDHYFHTVIRPYFSLYVRLTTGGTAGLAEWIMDDTCRV